MGLYIHADLYPSPVMAFLRGTTAPNIPLSTRLDEPDEGSACEGGSYLLHGEMGLRASMLLGYGGFHTWGLNVSPVQYIILILGTPKNGP